MSEEEVRDSMWLSIMGAGVSETYVDAGGVSTRSLTAGDGPPLILLHGTGGHAETYQRNIVPLSEHFTVHAIDMVGHGFTDRPDIDYSLDDYADHVVSFMDGIGADQAYIQGESLGANVAAWTAIKYPDRTPKIVCNTGVLAYPTEEGLQKLEDLVARTEALKADLTMDNIRRRLSWLVKDPDSMTEEMAAIRFKIYSQPGMMDSMIKIMHSSISFNRGDFDIDYFRPGIMGQIRCPVLFLWTSHNPGKSADLVREIMKDMSDAQLHVVEDAGHWPQFEKADEVNRVLIDFLDG